MRRLARAALGFSAAVFLAEYALPASGLPYIAAALAVLSLIALRWPPARRAGAFLVLLPAAAGLLCWWGHYERHVLPCEALVGQTVTVTAVVTDYPREGEGYVRLSVRVEEGAPRERAALYIYGQDIDLPELAPGDVIQAEVKLSSAVIRSGERSRTYTAQNQNLLGYIQGDVTVTGQAAYKWIYFPKELCQAVKTLCDRLFPADTTAFMKALLTGDTVELQADREDYTAMRLSGVLHIVSVSGMHLFVLTGFV